VWNVVRAFHREGRLRQFTQVLLAGRPFPLPEGEPEIIYWSADATGQRWPLLREAQDQFREARNRGSEPDIALWWPDKCLIFVEAKLASRNQSGPSPSRAASAPGPEGSDNPPDPGEVPAQRAEALAIAGDRDQLLRHWRLGSWIADRHGASFWLVNLVRWGEERDIEVLFAGRGEETPQRRFARATWESIWDSLTMSGLADQTVDVLDTYFADKSCGYDSQGRLQEAFAGIRDNHSGRRTCRNLEAEDAEGDFLWFHNRDAWRRFWGPPRTMQQLVFHLLRGSNDAHLDLHHQAASECDLDYKIARNIVEAFLASGWEPPKGVPPRLHDGDNFRRGI